MCCKSVDQIPYMNHRLVCWLSWPRADLVLNIISCLRKRLITSNLRQTFLLMRFPLFSMAQSFKKRVYKMDGASCLVHGTLTVSFDGRIY
jgi:hypothetical protein